MTIPTIFETCRPREDVLLGAVAEADFAADLASVIAGKGSSSEYRDPDRFFARTWPMRGLRNLLADVSRRLSGSGGEVAAIFRLDTSYGGGKTHGFIAIAHAARGMAKVSNAAEFVDSALLPQSPVRVVAFDGENVDPANGRAMGRPGDGVHAHTPWGETAFELAGSTGYERERKHDYPISEDLALALGLLFRTLAPMRSRANIRAVAEGIKAMGREEATYWLGMAMHRKHPRRVLTALRILLTEPKRPVVR